MTERDMLPQAVVREIDGRLVLDDPVAVEFVKAIGKHNCEGTLSMNKDRVEHFKVRMTELCLSPQEAVITILNVDDQQGAILADVLMPGHNWQAYRDRGEVPFARGLAGREVVQEFLEHFDPEASSKLRGAEDLSVVVVDHQVAEVFIA